MSLFRASSVGKLMTSPNENKLPVGAITELDKLVSQHILKWKDAEKDFLALKKGIQCEDDSIEIYNQINSTFYLKNATRVNKGNLTGECDIIDYDKSLVIDIKTAYSKATFPLILKASTLYEWQLRSYMYLYDVDNSELAYILTKTPANLIDKRDPEHWHKMDDVDMKHRKASVSISRDKEKEGQLLARLDLCERYYKEKLLSLQ